MIASTPAGITEAALATQAFKRITMSAGVGILGAGIMVFPHLSTYPWRQYLPWVIAMVMVFIFRILFARYALWAIAAGKDAIRLVNFEAVCCALTGFGWGSAIFVFDSESIDALYYVRLMILAAAMSFVISSLTVYLRIFLAYMLSVGFTVVAFIASFGRGELGGTMLACVIVYMILLAAVAAINNRRIRKAVANHLAVERLSEELRVALGNELKANQALSRSAITDELTGIINRRGVLNDLEIEIARCQRYGRPLTVLMIDIDHFKDINDSHGHASGDDALRSIVQSMTTVLREADVIGRFGGEEFLVLLPDLGGDGAIAAAQRLRERVETSELMLAERREKVTISIGVSFYKSNDTSSTLVARADKALYRAKANGRNRVEIE
ncbi:MAG: GGDEF domain-containing protein [Sulfuritalea sp.]|nr:GGDEF domain-containing protein [Sulfuritalea sp.]